MISRYCLISITIIEYYDWYIKVLQITNKRNIEEKYAPTNFKFLFANGITQHRTAALVLSIR